jgi:hypothetical protein
VEELFRQLGCARQEVAEQELHMFQKSAPPDWELYFLHPRNANFLWSRM